MPRKISRGHPSKEPSLLNYERCDKKGWHSVPPIPSCSSRTFTKLLHGSCTSLLTLRSPTGNWTLFPIAHQFRHTTRRTCRCQSTQTKECSEPTYTLRFGLRAFAKSFPRYCATLVWPYNVHSPQPLPCAGEKKCRNPSQHHRTPSQAILWSLYHLCSV